MKTPANNQIMVTQWSMQVLGIGGGWVELPTVWISGPMALELYHALGTHDEYGTASVATTWTLDTAGDQVMLTITVPNAGRYTVLFDATRHSDLLDALATTPEKQVRLVLDGTELPSDDDPTEESEYPYSAKYGLALFFTPSELDRILSRYTRSNHDSA